MRERVFAMCLVAGCAANTTPADSDRPAYPAYGADTGPRPAPGTGGPADGLGPDQRPDGGAPGLDGGSVDADSPGVDAGVPDAASTERCRNGLDDDRDGVIDEDCPCAIGDFHACYPGDPTLADVGSCNYGIFVCERTDRGLAWGPCQHYGEPSAEVCDGEDNDCDGVTDTGCACEVDSTQACYPGPASTQDVGRCRAGVKTCSLGSGGAPVFGACTGAVLPAGEACSGGIDEDCDGQTDCADSDCAGSAACGTGGPGTATGSVTINGISFCTTMGGMASSAGMGSYAGCGGAWGTGGEITASAPGHYRVCASFVGSVSGCHGPERCVEADVGSAGGTATLAAFEGFWANDACGVELRDQGGNTCARLYGSPTGGAAFEADLGCTPRVCGYYNLGPECHRWEDLSATF